MAAVSELRDGLRARLATITGLRAHDIMPDDIVVPAAVVNLETLTYDATMGRGGDDYIFIVTVLVGAAHDRAGHDALDGYLAGSGATSIKTVIEADGSLGGVADFARVAAVRNYGFTEYAGVQYLAADLVVEVTA